MPKAIQPEIPFNDSEDILKRVKESGICWFESNNGHQQAGSVNTFTDSGSKNVGFFLRVSYPLKANLFISPSDGVRSRSSRARGIRSAPRPYTGSGGKPTSWAKFMG